MASNFSGDGNEGVSGGSAAGLRNFLLSFNGKPGCPPADWVDRIMQLVAMKRITTVEGLKYFFARYSSYAEDADIRKDMADVMMIALADWKERNPASNDGDALSRSDASDIAAFLFCIFRCVHPTTNGQVEPNNGTMQRSKSTKSTQDAFFNTVVVRGEDGKRHKTAPPGCMSTAKRDKHMRLEIHAILDNHLNNGNRILDPDEEYLGEIEGEGENLGAKAKRVARDEIRDAYNSNFDEKKAEIEANPAAFSDDIKQFYTEANKAKQVALKMQRNGAVWEWLSNRRKEAKNNPALDQTNYPRGRKKRGASTARTTGARLTGVAETEEDSKEQSSSEEESEEDEDPEWGRKRSSS
ncbi:hypothetical protein Ndes2437A_g06738 [Nannochloris sp. 'desiccata']